MPYYAYILLCADGTLYSGYAKDAVARLAVHNRGEGAKYTRSRLPAALVHTEEFATRQEAMRRECQLKRLSRAEKLELIASQAATLPPANK